MLCMSNTQFDPAYTGDDIGIPWELSCMDEGKSSLGGKVCVFCSGFSCRLSRSSSVSMILFSAMSSLWGDGSNASRSDDLMYLSELVFRKPRLSNSTANLSSASPFEMDWSHLCTSECSDVVSDIFLLRLIIRARELPCHSALRFVCKFYVDLWHVYEVSYYNLLCHTSTFMKHPVQMSLYFLSLIRVIHLSLYRYTWVCYIGLDRIFHHLPLICVLPKILGRGGSTQSLRDAPPNRVWFRVFDSRLK